MYKYDFRIRCQVKEVIALLQTVGQSTPYLDWVIRGKKISGILLQKVGQKKNQKTKTMIMIILLTIFP